MKITTFCPISIKKIDEHVARLNGAFTILFLTVFILFGNIAPVIILLVDFALRSGQFSRYSLLSFISRNVAKLFLLKPVMINAGPKIFAARIGLLFNFAIILSFISGFNNSSYLFTSVFGVCALLESAFGFCVACRFYPFVYKLTFHSDIQKIKI